MKRGGFKTCSCGRTYDLAEWNALPHMKLQTFDWGEIHEMRNCPCGSTIVIVVDRGETQEPKVDDIWKSKEGAAQIKITKLHGTGVSYKTHPGRGKSRGFRDFADFYKTFTPVRRTP